MVLVLVVPVLVVLILVVLVLVVLGLVYLYDPRNVHILTTAADLLDY